MKKNNALNLILPATDPVIIAGVIRANIIWNATKTNVGNDSVRESFVMPVSQKFLKDPIKLPPPSPNDNE